MILFWMRKNKIQVRVSATRNLKGFLAVDACLKSDLGKWRLVPSFRKINRDCS